LNGLFNLFYPLLDAFDWSLGFLPAVLRVVVLGALSGAAAMGLYVLLSDQAKIRARKEEIQRIRVDLAAAKDDFNETMRLSRRNLAASFKLLGVVIGPALLSSLPLLAVIGWLAAHYGYVLPAAGTPVPVAFEPPAADGVAVEPPGALLTEAGGGPPRLLWPAPAGAPPRFVDAGGLVYAGPPADQPATIVHKRVWWNWLLGNEAGYLRPDARVDAITFDLAPRVLVPGVPSWLGGWEAVYFLAVFASSLLIKFGFRIE
jgi:uncharacterized membrane protein (DUF106 family)